MRVVAVFPCASGIGQEIFHALDGHKDVVLYGINSGEDNPGSRLYGDRYVGSAPPMTEPDALAGFIRRACEEKGIAYIFPAYDDAGVWLKRHEARLGASVIGPSLETMVVCRSKTRTYEALRGAVRVPRQYPQPTEDDLPVFVKPDAGEGSKRCRLAADKAGLDIASDEICVEYFPGEEYTVDCLTLDDTFAFPRVRHGVRAGLSVHTFPAELPGAREMAREIARRLGMKGAWFFQCRIASDGRPGLLEVAPRIAGAMSLRRYAGVNFPLLSLLCFAGEPVRLAPGAAPRDVVKIYRDSVRFEHEFDAIFCDLDDTLVKGGRVCPQTVGFLYRWAGSKEIVLITRHAGDVPRTLDEHRISPLLFSRVIHLRHGEPKSDHVSDGSLFIDDSFRERYDVLQRRRNVLCLDVDALSGSITFSNTGRGEKHDSHSSVR